MSGVSLNFSILLLFSFTATKTSEKFGSMQVCFWYSAEICFVSLMLGIWRNLEILARKWALKYEVVHVISGSIFDGDENGIRDDDRAPKK